MAYGFSRSFSSKKSIDFVLNLFVISRYYYKMLSCWFSRRTVINESVVMIKYGDYRYGIHKDNPISIVYGCLKD